MDEDRTAAKLPPNKRPANPLSPDPARDRALLNSIRGRSSADEIQAALYEAGFMVVNMQKLATELFGTWGDGFRAAVDQANGTGEKPN